MVAVRRAASCPRARGGRTLRRCSGWPGQQPAGQPHGALPRCGACGSEAQHPCPGGEHDRLDRVAQLAAGRRDRPLTGVQGVRSPARARAQARSACPGRAQPSTDRRGRAPEARGDRAVPLTAGGQRERLADHRSRVAAARQRPRRTEHMRRLAASADRPSWRELARAVRHPHLARATKTPPRQLLATVRTRDRAGRELGLQLLRSDRDDEHQG